MQKVTFSYFLQLLFLKIIYVQFFWNLEYVFQTFDNCFKILSLKMSTIRPVTHPVIYFFSIHMHTTWNWRNKQTQEFLILNIYAVGFDSIF